MSVLVIIITLYGIQKSALRDRRAVRRYKYRVLFVAQKGFAHPKGEMEDLVGWRLKGYLKQGRFGVWLRRRIRNIHVQVVYDKDQRTRRTCPAPHTALLPIAA